MHKRMFSWSFPRLLTCFTLCSFWGVHTNGSEELLYNKKWPERIVLVSHIYAKLYLQLSSWYNSVHLKVAISL
jgi:hypothetical protein